METLTLNDGTVITNAISIRAVVGLWIHLNGYTMQEAFSLFSDPSKTERITTDKTEPDRPDEPIIYEGYTDLFSIRIDDEGEIVVGLKEASDA